MTFGGEHGCCSIYFWRGMWITAPPSLCQDLPGMLLSNFAILQECTPHTAHTHAKNPDIRAQPLERIFTRFRGGRLSSIAPASSLPQPLLGNRASQNMPEQRPALLDTHTVYACGAHSSRCRPCSLSFPPGRASGKASIPWRSLERMPPPPKFSSRVAATVVVLIHRVGLACPA